ncbi:hypothetical protein ACVME8_002002 [Bradyrhizobium diazoefficiens]|uniref:hypothetical protein n=1 Tax=Bradyrhizobium diazoefficiens TaxID=1355477 RepID=UPI00272C6950|nr:hypothetical protein [Bradyrhizobium diazoefficiens]WLA64694.1 hypothetical protein QNN01_41625 [Bradyrhizobium diazoefficiens]
MRTTQRVAGFRSECPAGFELECMAGFVGIRTLGTQPIIQNAWRNIPATVEALRQFWMPIRFKRGA